MPFDLPPLPYKTDALEPFVDAKTMEIHHGKHHQTYVTKLNNAVSDHPHLSTSSLEGLCKEHAHLPAIRNNGGGHYNHSLFWTLLSANKDRKTIPDGALGDAINSSFGSFEKFKEAFTQAALTRFGSGWAWLCRKDNTLSVCSTPNQDNPLMPDCGSACSGNACLPLAGLDVWEHAYYLKYQNRRPEYVAAFFQHINWDVVTERFLS